MRVPLYRLQGHGDHFYTTSESERDNAVSQYGYEIEGIACYVDTEAGAYDSAFKEEICCRVLSHVLALQLSISMKGGHVALDPKTLKETVDQLVTEALTEIT